METITQTSTSTSVPWYRTRWFWGLILVGLLGISFLMFFIGRIHADSSDFWIVVVKSIILGSGGAVSYLIGAQINQLLNTSFENLFALALIHVTILSALLFGVFRNKRVHFGYLITALLLIVLGNIIAGFLVSVGA